jgi:hypothetical protein
VPLGVAAAIVGLLLVLPSAPVEVQPVGSELPASCGDEGEKCEQRFTVSGGSALAALANAPLTGNPEVTHAVVVLHGTGRNPVSAFASMLAAADKAGVTGRTLVLAPQFKSGEDDPGKGEAVWDEDGWKQGDAAEEPAGGPSSFAVMDEILTMLADRQRFANLRRITVAGHSAGGQFAQRYAAFGLAPNQLRDVAVDYVVANPSSFMYFDAARPTSGGSGFAEPAAPKCADYDSYKYGMRGRTGYAARLTPEQALATYASRRVTAINGADDTVDNGNLDTDCQANLQGPNLAGSWREVPPADASAGSRCSARPDRGARGGPRQGGAVRVRAGHQGAVRHGRSRTRAVGLSAGPGAQGGPYGRVGQQQPTPEQHERGGGEHGGARRQPGRRVGVRGEQPEQQRADAAADVHPGLGDRGRGRRRRRVEPDHREVQHPWPRPAQSVTDHRADHQRRATRHRQQRQSGRADAQRAGDHGEVVAGSAVGQPTAAHPGRRADHAAQGQPASIRTSPRTKSNDVLPPASPASRSSPARHRPTCTSSWTPESSNDRLGHRW